MFGKMMVRSSIAAMRFVLGVILAFTLAVVHADTIYVCNANSNTVRGSRRAASVQSSLLA